jgi:transcriptional regulator with XRE-family HTH domain
MDRTHSDTERADIARKVRRLREERRWTQAELSRRLGLSQSRLSEIEHGHGSFTAEQFLTILKLFNVSVSHFANRPSDRQADIQNALARLGATHLVEDSDVLPSDLFSEVGTLVREILIAPESPRHVTALGPVLVRHADRITLSRLRGELFPLGLEQRLGWLLDNVREAIRAELHANLDREWLARYRRAELILDDFTVTLRPRQDRPRDDSYDILDANIRSPKTLRRVREDASPISQQWRVVTAIRTEDFVDALRASRVSH